MERFNSMRDFENEVLKRALAKKSTKSICGTKCKSNTPKAKVRTHKEKDSVLHIQATNLSTVANQYLNDNLKSTKRVAQTIDLSLIGENGSKVTIKRSNQSGSSSEVKTTMSTSIKIEGNVSYGAANLSSTATASWGKDQTNTSYEKEQSEQECVFTFKKQEDSIMEIYHNTYSCSESPILDVMYTFDKVTVRVACTYKGENGEPYDSGSPTRIVTRTYDMQDLGFVNGRVMIKTPVIFDYSQVDEWPSISEKAKIKRADIKRPVPPTLKK